MRLALLALALFSLAACGARQRGEVFLDQLPPPTLLAPGALAPDVVLRQHVSATWATGETEFDAVVQKHEGTLKLVALSPTGQPGFVLTLHEDGEVSVENRTGRELPFRPERILADVQKVFYPWVEDEEDTDPIRDGARRARAGEHEVEERLLEGRLVERRFFSPGAPNTPEVVVSYFGWADRRVAPSQAKIVHVTLGYELTIETFEEIVLGGLSE
jgi:hypothetical protein